jgi:serine protease Do
VTRTQAGTKITLQVIRNGRKMDLTVTIGDQPGPAKTASVDRAADYALAGLEVQSLDSRMARELGLQGKPQGVVVVGVEPDSGAERAGIVQGDVIHEINRKPVKSVKDFEQIASEVKKDEQVLMLINRRGNSLFVTVKV